MSQKVEFLTPLQHIQTRPGMYVDTASPRSLLKELCDNSTDELLNGYASKIEIEYDSSQKPGECTMYFIQDIS